MLAPSTIHYGMPTAQTWLPRSGAFPLPIKLAFDEGHWLCNMAPESSDVLAIIFPYPSEEETYLPSRLRACGAVPGRAGTPIFAEESVF